MIHNGVSRFGAVTEIDYDESGRQVYSEDWNNSRQVSWTNGDQIRSVHVNDVLKSKSYYDGSGARRIHETYPAGRKETIAYGGEHMTLRNGVDLTYHIYAEGQRVASREGANYTSGETIWFHTDRLGSTVNSTDANGELTSTMEYFPSGEPWIQRFESSSAQAALPKFMFAGKEYDEATGLYNFGARHYDPRMGVWMSPDPAMPEYFVSSLAGGVYQPKNLNTYSYAWNNPVSVGDSDGRAAHIVVGALVGAAAGGVLEGTMQIVRGKFDPVRLAVRVGEGAAVGAVAGMTGGLSLVGQAGVSAATSVAVGAVGREILDEEHTASGVVRDAAAGVGGVLLAKGVSLLKNTGLGRLYTKARGAPKGVCFLGGTEIDTQSGWVSIENIKVGDRVLTSGEVDSQSTRVDPETWRLIRATMPNPDGSDDLLEFELLRSFRWIEERGAEIGHRVEFELPEMGLYGRATIHEIEDCPDIARGDGRVVLSTVTHFNANVWKIKFEGSEEELEPTGLHRLFSEDRQRWVRVQDLLEGETLRTKGGPAVIAQLSRLPGLHRVYNLEVETEHEYLASKLGVLSHNTDCAKPVGRNANEAFFKTDKEAAVAAEKLGFKKMRGVRSSGRAIFKKGRRYISADGTGHNGGAFKMADSVKGLEAKESRMGTYDQYLNRIGD